MNFEPVHIHKIRRGSHENILFLLIPILLFVLAIAFIVSKAPRQEVAGISTGLTQDSQK